MSGLQFLPRSLRNFQTSTPTTLAVIDKIHNDTTYPSGWHAHAFRGPDDTILTPSSSASTPRRRSSHTHTIQQIIGKIWSDLGMRDDSRHRCSGVAIPRPTPTLQKEAPDEVEVQGRGGRSRAARPGSSSRSERQGKIHRLASESKAPATR